MVSGCCLGPFPLVARVVLDCNGHFGGFVLSICRPSPSPRMFEFGLFFNVWGVRRDNPVKKMFSAADCFLRSEGACIQWLGKVM